MLAYPRGVTGCDINLKPGHDGLAWMVRRHELTGTSEVRGDDATWRHVMVSSSRPDRGLLLAAKASKPREHQIPKCPRGLAPMNHSGGFEHNPFKRIAFRLWTGCCPQAELLTFSSLLQVCPLRSNPAWIHIYISPEAMLGWLLAWRGFSSPPCRCFTPSIYSTNTNFLPIFDLHSLISLHTQTGPTSIPTRLNIKMLSWTSFFISFFALIVEADAFANVT